MTIKHHDRMDRSAVIYLAALFCTLAAACAADEPAAKTAPAKVKIVLAGDSTVAEDQGWGPAFARRLAGNVECVNLARNGRSSKSYRNEGLWKQCLDVRPNFLLIQFGHNDEPGKGPERETDPKTTYRQNISQYIDEAREVGAEPVLITSLARRKFDSTGKIQSSLVPYVDVVKELAEEKKVPLVDLHARSIEFYERLGRDGCRELASQKEDGSYDATHLSPKGSETVADLVVAELKKSLPASEVWFAVDRPAAAGRIAGYIGGHHSRDGAVIIICDGKTGIPLRPSTWRPMTEDGTPPADTKAVFYTRSGNNGQFAIEHVPAGTYRLVAQSWSGQFTGVFDLNGEVIELHGVADDIKVPSPEAEKVGIQPLGTGILQLDQNFGNSDGLMVVSTQPPIGDPILGFHGLGEQFGKHVIGGNRMPYGRTTIVGLPPGKVHVAIFMPDNSPGYGAASYEVAEGKPHAVSIVAGWSDAQHDPPERLRALTEAIRKAAGAEGNAEEVFYKLTGVDPAEVRRMRLATEGAGRQEREAAYMKLIGPLDREVEVPDIGKVPVLDVWAATSYARLQRAVESRGKKSK